MHSGQSGLQNFLINNAYLCVFLLWCSESCHSLWVENQNRKQLPSNMPVKQRLSSMQKTPSAHRIQITKAQAALCDKVREIARANWNTQDHSALGASDDPLDDCISVRSWSKGCSKPGKKI
jgi:hypothetical protein